MGVPTTLSHACCVATPMLDALEAKLLSAACFPGTTIALIDIDVDPFGDGFYRLEAKFMTAFGPKEMPVRYFTDADMSPSGIADHVTKLRDEWCLVLNGGTYSDQGDSWR